MTEKELQEGKRQRYEVRANWTGVIRGKLDMAIQHQLESMGHAAFGEVDGYDAELLAKLLAVRDSATQRCMRLEALSRERVKDEKL